MSDDLGVFTIFRLLYSIVLYCRALFCGIQNKCDVSFFENITSHCLPVNHYWFGPEYTSLNALGNMIKFNAELLNNNNMTLFKHDDV